jgi:UDP-N-acetylglucosamine acyltransferase
MRISGINRLGLRRSGLDRETIARLDQAFKIIFRTPDLLTRDALDLTMQEIPDCPQVSQLVEFFRTSKRGVVKRIEENGE